VRKECIYDVAQRKTCTAVLISLRIFNEVMSNANKKNKHSGIFEVLDYSFKIQ
jgi:hypothetical protein